MSFIGKTFKVAHLPGFLTGHSAYTGRILRVDLSAGELWVDEPDDDFYRRFIGGRNIILHYLLTVMPARAEPLGPENLLIFAPGLLTGTVLPGAGRHAIGGKSPLTGALGSCEAGGWWGAELKRAGFDAIIIQGKAETPVYLWIKDGFVEIRDAAPLWGRRTADVQHSLRQELGDEKIRVAQIGPAGENLVRFASIMHDINRAAGRSGLGAVMGSKQLKAVAVRGTLPVGIADKKMMATVQKWVNENYKTQMGWAIASGTSGSVKSNHDVGATAINNYRQGVFEGIEHLDASTLFPLLVSDRDTCNKCAVRCKLVVDYDSDDVHIDGDYGGPEYESIGALGPLCGISDPVAVTKANELCAAYGLDTISTGGTIAFAMEANKKGLLPADTDGPRFGDGASLVENIHRIATRQGLGDWMAEGSARMAARLGPGAEEMLAVGRGQELPLHDPRLKHTMAMGYALSATGADHMHNLNDTFASFEGGDIAIRLKEMGVPAPLPLWGISEHKIEGFYYETAFKNFYDCAVICHFYPYEYRHMVAALSAAGGWQFTADEINAVGVRAITMGRLFLLREGFTAQDDALSARAYHKLSDGPIAGKGLEPGELRRWLQVYYRRMGWDENGGPMPEALAALDLAELEEIR
jgi:aldehyde:ferredoxin oxidoreductase